MKNVQCDCLKGQIPNIMIRVLMSLLLGGTGEDPVFMLV